MSSAPTISGFIAFLRTVVGVTTTQLPDASPTIGTAYAVALEIVNVDLAVASPTMYALAVYNLGASNVINYAQDLLPLVPFPDEDSGVGFFAYMRAKFDCLSFVSGVIQSSSDESTANSMVVQEAAKNFTLANLQQLKDPWGRQYLAIAQTYGPAAWGIN